MSEGEIYLSELRECYTGIDFNNDLKELTTGYLKVAKLRSHSFRSGVTSEMAVRGFSDEDIKRQGRWSSQAYANYIKLNRVQRIRIARSIIKKCT